jgi:hypothetical protein
VQKWEKNFKETRKQKIIMMNFCWPLINMHDDNSSFFCLKMIYAVSCQEENSRQKRFQVQEDFPKNCSKLTKKSTGACLGMIHMILVSVETQSCND